MLHRSARFLERTCSLLNAGNRAFDWIPEFIPGMRMILGALSSYIRGDACCLIALLAIAIGLGSSAQPLMAQRTDRYVNPVASEIRMGDPAVIQYEGAYYLTGTTDADEGFRLWKSGNLIDWQPLGWIFRKSKTTWAQQALWAPELFVHEGRFYLCFSARGVSSKGFRLVLAGSDRIEGPYEEIHAPWCDQGYAAIDAHVFESQAGQLYLYFARVGVGEEPERRLIGEIYGAPLRNDLTGVTSAPQLLLEADQEWERVPGGRSWCNEGPFVIENDGGYFMTYSANHYLEAEYGIGYATSESPLGPWLKGADNPLVAADPEVGVSGPGHNTIVPSPDGTEWFLVYHAHADPESPSGERTVNIDRLVVGEGRLKTDAPTRSHQPPPNASSGSQGTGSPQ